MNRTDVPLDDLTAEDARRILSALSPMLERLRGIARSGRRLTPPGLSDRSRSRRGERSHRPVPNGLDFPSELGQFPLATARDLVEREWNRRSGRDETPADERFRPLISSLLARGLEPDSPFHESAARASLREARRVLDREGRTTEHVDRELHALSGAFWHVLLTADIPVERAIAMRERIDEILLDGVEAAYGVLLATCADGSGADPSH